MRNVKLVPNKKTAKRRSVVAIATVVIGIYLSLVWNSPGMFITGIMSGTLCAIVASFKYRSPSVWFALGFWCPIIGLIVIVCLRRLYFRICPYCCGGIDVETIICPHCYSHLSSKSQEFFTAQQI